jgi:RNA polymerase sigma factor (sigma-70 family)
MTVHSAPLLHDLRHLAGLSAVDPVPDAELLERFVHRRDEGAFAALVARHGPMVLRLCRRTAADAHAAEDCFQSTFLVLARNAASVRRREALAAWLYGVAARVARQSRTSALRRRTESSVPAEGAPADPHSNPLDTLTVRELLTAVDEEVNRLPEAYRLPVILCCLEGRTREEAAQQLGWTSGAVKGRLERGRTRLRARLAKRGLALSVALTAVEVSQASTAKVPAALANSTVRAALGVPVARGAVWLKLTWLLPLLVGAAALGIGIALPPPPVQEPPGEPNQVVQNPAPRAVPVPERAGKDLHGDPLPPHALARLGTVRFRHGARVSHLALAPDGHTLASIGHDKVVRLWDLATGRELRRFELLDNTGGSVAFSPDGTLLAATGNGLRGGVVLWEVKTGREVRRWREANDWFLQAVFSPAGKTLAAVGYHHRIFLWEVETGQLIRCLDGKEETLFRSAIAFSPDGRTLASSRLGRVIQLWDATTGQELRRLKLPPLREARSDSNAASPDVYGLQFSPDGKQLASAGLNQDVCLWEVATGKQIRTLPAESIGTLQLAFSPNGRLLATAANSGLVRLWEAATGKEVAQFQTARQRPNSILFSGDGQSLVLSGAASSISVWDVRTGKERFPDRGHTEAILQCSLLPDGRTVITGGGDGPARQWDLATSKELRRLPPPDPSDRSVIVSPDGKVAVSFIRQSVPNTVGGVRLWDVATGKEIAVLWRPYISSAFFSPDGKTLFTNSAERKERNGELIGQKGVIRAWASATGQELRVVAEHKDDILGSAVLSADGKLLAARTDDPEFALAVWHVDTGKVLCRLPRDLQFNQALAFSPRHNLLAVMDGPRRLSNERNPFHHVQLWDIASGKKVGEFGRSADGHFLGAFSTDGRILATSGEDNRIRLWEVATGAERLILEGHTGTLENLLFAERGRKLISSSDDTTALVWDVTGLRRGEAAPKRRVGRAELEALWADLKGSDAAKAGRAVWALVAAAQDVVPFLGEKLWPARPPDAKQIIQLLSELHSDRFSVRSNAEQELAKFEELAEPCLRKELAKGPPVEVRRRVEKMLEPLEKVLLTGERLRTERALEVLEHAGIAEARRLLEGLATGAPAARLTREAQAAMQRLRQADGPGRQP